MYVYIYTPFYISCLTCAIFFHEIPGDMNFSAKKKNSQTKPGGFFLVAAGNRLGKNFVFSPRLAALASRTNWSEKTGFFVIDPAEDCAAMGDVRQLLTTWSSQGQVPLAPVSGWAWFFAWKGWEVKFWSWKIQPEMMRCKERCLLFCLL